MADFTAGTPETGTAVQQTADGEVALAAAAGSSEFLAFPADWTSFPWDGSGSATVQTGQLVVDGARASTQLGIAYGPGTSVEFRATFGAVSFQSVGFAGGNDSVNGMFGGLPWATFGTPSGSTKLHARVWASGGASVDVDLDPGNTLNLIGTPHTYRIDWTESGFEFFVDGISRQHPGHPDRRDHAHRRERRRLGRGPALPRLAPRVPVRLRRHLPLPRLRRRRADELGHPLLDRRHAPRHAPSR